VLNVKIIKVLIHFCTRQQSNYFRTIWFYYNFKGSLMQWYILLPSEKQLYINDQRISILTVVTCFGCYTTIIRPY